MVYNYTHMYMWSMEKVCFDQMLAIRLFHTKVNELWCTGKLMIGLLRHLFQ